MLKAQGLHFGSWAHRAVQGHVGIEVAPWQCQSSISIRFSLTSLVTPRGFWAGSREVRDQGRVLRSIWDVGSWFKASRSQPPRAGSGPRVLAQVPCACLSALDPESLAAAIMTAGSRYDTKHRAARGGFWVSLRVPWNCSRISTSLSHIPDGPSSRGRQHRLESGIG